MSQPRRGESHVVIRASAGTGKTFQLSNRFLRLIAADEACDGILATTFTRKAAGEILARVLLRLADAAAEPKKLSVLCEQLGQPLDRARCQQLLAGLLRRLHRLRVSTLDSFFIQIARSFSLELGLSPGWQIVDEIYDGGLRAEAIRTVLQKEATGDVLRLMHLLSKGEASLSVTDQIRQIVNTLYSVFLESSCEAWESLPRYKPLEPDELRRAIDALATVDCSDATSIAKARDTAVFNLQQEQWLAFLSKGVAAKILAGSDVFNRKPISAEVDAAYQPLIGHCKAVLLGQIANQTAATRRLLEHFDAAYQRIKTARRALRFEDVTRRLCGGAMADRLEEIVYRLDGHVSHLLLDEFQDTAPLQWRVLRPFARRVVDGRDRSFFCVGDVKQAIYGWRGGEAEIFDAIQAELTQLQSESLNRSWRSSQPVIDTVNRVFQGLATNPVLERYPAAAGQWSRRFETHSTARAELPGYCRLVAAPDEAEGQTQEEATWIFAAEEVARLHREAPGFSIGVLVRRNRAVARLIYELRQRGVEASEEGGNPLTDSSAVELILSLLCLADHPGHTAARFHVAHSPLAAAVGLLRHDDDAAAWRVSGELRRRLMQGGYGETVLGWVRALAPHCDARDLSRMEQLVELAHGYQVQAGVRVDDFINMVSKKRVEDPRSADVRVMTVHQSKGLEFDIVVLPELEARLVGQSPQLVQGRDKPAGEIEHVCRYVPQEIRGLLPPRFQQLFDDHERRVAEESLCVLYVALTRAAQALHMIVAPSPPNENSLRSTYAGVLRGALTDGGPLAPGQVAYEHGDPRWFVAMPPKAKRPRPVEAEGPLVVRLAATDMQAIRGLERRSPSSLEGGTCVDLAFRMRLDTAEALDRGTLIHAWFQQIEWLDGGQPDEESLLATARQLRARQQLRSNVGVSRLVAAFRKAVELPEILAALSKDAYQAPPHGKPCTPIHAVPTVAKPRWQVWRERPFAIREGDAILSGQIDRLVALYDGDRVVGADILDYKTDVFADRSPAAVAARVAFYRPQLEAYRRAVARLFALPSDRVSARLVFVELGLVSGVE